jgi:DNA primase
VFTFIEHFHHKSKGEALKFLAHRFGVDLGREKQARPRSNPLQDVLQAAVSHYRKVLRGRAESMTYLTTDKPNGRGHRPETIDIMETGLSDGRLAESLQAGGIPLDKIKQSGLYVEKKDGDGKPTGEWKDFFCPGVFIYPHRTESGDIGHFTLKDPRKRIDYQLRSENRLNGLEWGNQKAIKQDTVILVEGEDDLASFLDAGATNVMSCLGQLSEQQLRWLTTRATGKTFILWFDYDIKPGARGQPPAGIKYTRQVYRRLLQTGGCQAAVASDFMAPGEDPDDWIQKDRATAAARIKASVKKARHPLLWELRRIPETVREDAGDLLSHLKDLDFFDLLGQVDEIQRDAIILELQKLGFMRESVLNSITVGYGLKDALEVLNDAWEENQRRSEVYMRLFATRTWNYFRDHGKFFVAGDDSLHLFYHHKIYKLGDNMPWKALLHREAGLNFTTQLAKYVNEEVKAKCLSAGERMNSFSWIHSVYTGETPMIYLNLKDPMNRICRLSSGEVDLVENGTNEHSVLLAESSQMQPFTYDPEVCVASGMRAMRVLVFDALACDPAQRYLVLAWALSAYLMPLSETKALMKMEGGTSSGKTTAAKFISLLLYGDSMVGRSTTASDYAMGSTEPLIIKDNLETDDLNKNALNFLLLAATGAKNLKRSSGTESGVTAECINCLVAITAIEPFSKPELINRTYIVDFSRRWHRADFIETANVMKLLGSRDLIISAWLTVLADEVLGALDDRSEIIEYIRKQHKGFSKDRTTEFISLLVLITRALLKYMPLSENLRLDAGERRQEYFLLDSWVRIQDESARQTEQGTNVVLQLLEGLRRTYQVEFITKANPHDEELFVPLMGCVVRRLELPSECFPSDAKFEYSFVASTQELLQMMQRYAREQGVRCPFKSAQQLGARIHNELNVLLATGWEIQRDKLVHGTRYTRFTWRDEVANQ